MQNKITMAKPFEEYVASVKVKSENLIKNIFPRKIAELNELLDSDEFSFSKQQKVLHEALNNPAPDDAAVDDSANDGCESDDEQSSSDEDENVNKKRKMNNGEATAGCRGVPAILSGFKKCNGVVSKLIDIVKPYAREAADDANLLKMWLTLLIPKIEDGNNFGVEVQETILMETIAAEKKAAQFYEGIVQYHTGRGVLLRKMAKNPQIEDFRKAVVELDEHQLTILRTAMTEIRNRYAEVYDLMTKNWEKIIRPRSSNAENMY